MNSNKLSLQELLQLRAYLESSDFQQKFMEPATKLCNGLKVEALEKNGGQPNVLADLGSLTDRVVWLHKTVSDRVIQIEDEVQKRPAPITNGGYRA